MEKSEALRVFGLDAGAGDDEIRQAIEDQLFDIKKDIMQKYMVPMLLKKKQQSLHNQVNAESVLLPSTGADRIPGLMAWAGKPEDRITFLREYESHMSQQKLALMQVQSFADLQEVIGQLILTQEYYMALFRLLFAEYNAALPEEVNTREMIDTGSLLQSLHSGGPDNRTMLAIEMELARIEKIQKLS